MVDRVEVRTLVATRDTTADKNWLVIDTTSGEKIQTLAGRWQKDQVEVMCLLILRHYQRGHDEGILAGNLQAINSVRQALLLEPLGGV